MKKLSIFCLLWFLSIPAFGFRTLVFLEGKKLMAFSGDRKRQIADGVTFVCGPYYLKGDKLYYMLMDSGRYIDSGVTRLMKGSYLKGNKLYMLYGMNSKFVSDKVTRVFSRCLD